MSIKSKNGETEKEEPTKIIIITRAALSMLLGTNTSNAL